MQTTIDNNITINMRKSARAKKLLLRIFKGQPELVIPKSVGSFEARRFLEQERTVIWLKKRLTNQKKLSFAHNSRLHILGIEYRVAHDDSKSRGVELTDSELILYGDTQIAHGRITRFLSRILKEKISYLADSFCQKLGVKYKQIRIKEMSTRLGSCSNIGNLNFALRLVFAQESMLEYVVAHEVCHLREMNHGKNFWLIVEQIYPDWKKARKSIKNLI